MDGRRVVPDNGLSRRRAPGRENVKQVNLLPRAAASLGHASSLTGGLPAPASDVQNMLVGLDAICPAQHLIV